MMGFKKIDKEKVTENIEESILNNWDKRLLIEGSKNIVLKMYEDFGKNFPNILILPETAARPLYYLFDPIFEKLKQEKNTIKPKFIFFNVGKRADIAQNILEEEYGEDIEISEDLLKKAINSDFDPYKRALDYLDRDPKKIEDFFLKDAEVEKVAISRDYMKQRANEIKKLIENKNLSLAILDDFSSNGGTVKEIQKAFGQDDMPAYAISGFGAQNTDIGYVMDSKQEANPSTEHWNYSYSKSKAVGVTKDNEGKYSSVIKPESEEEKIKLVKEKKRLRDEMKSLGEEITNSIIALLNKKV